jgi:1-acylglycerone phosphate reductase
MIVNQTSALSLAVVPFQSAYNASKAAIAMFSGSQRLELEPFGITVVDLRTGGVNTNLLNNFKESTQVSLTKSSIYEPAKEVVEKALRGDGFEGGGMSVQQWAGLVVQDLLRKKPPPNIWRGSQAWLARIGSILPFGTLDGALKKMTGLDVVERLVQK